VIADFSAARMLAVIAHLARAPTLPYFCALPRTPVLALRRKTGVGAVSGMVKDCMESDERLFELWHRGDTTRNGGVGCWQEMPTWRPMSTAQSS
jgi:hypothetical protein